MLVGIAIELVLLRQHQGPMYDNLSSTYEAVTSREQHCQLALARDLDSYMLCRSESWGLTHLVRHLADALLIQEFTQPAE